jgi:hypothetical protein
VIWGMLCGVICRVIYGDFFLGGKGAGGPGDA